MRRFFITIIFSFLSTCIIAQTLHRHEVGFHVGFLGQLLEPEERADADGQLVKSYAPSVNPKDGHLVIALNYHYSLDKQWGIGLVTGFGYRSRCHSLSRFNLSDLYYRLRPASEYDVETGSLRSTLFFVMPSVRYFWPQTKEHPLRFFSEVSAGVVHQRYRFHSWLTQGEPISTGVLHKNKFAFHATAVGMIVDCGPMSLTAELGYGCQGLFNCGIAINL